MKISKTCNNNNNYMLFKWFHNCPLPGTMGKRLQNINLENTDDNRRKYRQLLFTADKVVNDSISGVILFDETFRQSSFEGKPFVEVL